MAADIGSIRSGEKLGFRWRIEEAKGFRRLAELVEIGRAAGVVQQEAFAERRIVEHVERHRLAAHQIDKILLERVTQQMRDTGCREAHEIPWPDLVFFAVDIGEATPG